MPIPETARAFMAGHVERLKQIRQKKRIVFPEGSDPRIQEAAERLSRDGLVEPIILCDLPPSDLPGVRCSPPDARYASLYHERRRSKGVTMMEAEEMSRKPLYHAALMVAAGDADGAVGGSKNTTAETVRAAFHCIGPSLKTKTVSSVYFLCVPDPSFGANGVLAFCDCAIVIEPTATMLAEMAIATGASVRTLVGVEPSVALLSFSTKGSGIKHPWVSKVVEALKIVRERAPELHIDGELQADAAIVPEIGFSKAKGSTVAGRANALVFPDLNSANISYKLVERLSGAAAIGPFTQGLAKPFNDLSRGCSADDIYSVAVITALQSSGAYDAAV